MAPFEINWQAPEFEYRSKNVSWYWISIIVAVIMLAASVWQKNFLFGFFVVIAEILVIIWANREPNAINFMVNEKGLTIGNEKFHAWSEMESWSAAGGDAESEWPSVYFQFRKRLKSAIKIKLPRAELGEIQAKLKTILPQIEHEQSLLETLEEFIGF